jgi:hypothetical protein
MPTHWHLVLWPARDGELTAFCRWLTHTHTMRWHAHYHTAGTGHLYQGRFKAFVVESDEHLATVCRYVERNPLRANLVVRAEQWRWSSRGVACTAMSSRARFCRRGRCRGRMIGSSASIDRRRRRSWKPCVGRFSAAVRTARPVGRSRRQGVWVWSARCVQRGDRRSPNRAEA